MQGQKGGCKTRGPSVFSHDQNCTRILVLEPLLCCVHSLAMQQNSNKLLDNYGPLISLGRMGNMEQLHSRESLLLNIFKATNCLEQLQNKYCY